VHPTLLARPSGRHHPVPDYRPAPKGRCYRDSMSPIAVAFPFSPPRGVIDTLSTISRLHRAGWPTYEVDSRRTITWPLMKVWEGHPSGRYRDPIATVVSLVITLCMREGSLLASASEIRRIRRLLLAAGSNFRFIIKLYERSFIDQY